MPRTITRRAAGAIGLAAMLATGGLSAASAQGRPVKIGVLNDQTTVYSDYQGVGSVIAAQLALEDWQKRSPMKVEMVSADHQNVTDIGVSLSRRWFDQDGVDLIIDVPNSAISFGVANLAREKYKVFIGSGAGTSDLTGKLCSPNTVHWTYDTWAYGHGLPKALVRQGAKRWFFISADYAFGKDLEANAAAQVKADGGEVVGAVRHPLGNADYSSFLLQSQASGADVIGIANAGDDTSNVIKQAGEFGVTPKQRLAGLIVNVNHIASLGLPAMQDVYLMVPFYWDRDEGTRAFARRFMARHPRGNAPNDMQAGVYSGMMHFLKAVEALGGNASDGKAVVAKMKELPVDDPIFGPGRIREDGRNLHPMYIYKTKTPAESTGKWDSLTLVSTLPAEEAFRPLSEGGCPLVGK